MEEILKEKLREEILEEAYFLGRFTRAELRLQIQFLNGSVKEKNELLTEILHSDSCVLYDGEYEIR